MIVGIDEFPFVLEKLQNEPTLSVDTETTGLKYYLGDRLFSIQIASKSNEFYFNFQPYPGLDASLVLPREKIREICRCLFTDATRVLYLHNAKFDLHFLGEGETDVHCKIHDTEVQARIIFNKHPDYKLSSCAARIGMSKDSAVDAYIREHNLYEVLDIGGRKEKKPRFDLVPFDIMSRYGLQDVRITYDLGEYQDNLLSAMAEDEQLSGREFVAIQTERSVTPVLFRIERKGLLIDKVFADKAYRWEQERIKSLEAKFKEQYGTDYVDSAKALGPLLVAEGDTLGKTEDNRDSISDYVLEACNSSLARLIQEHRDSSKRANTYWYNLINFTDSNGRVHPDFGQCRTVTHRMSCRDPNFQNVTNEDDSIFPIRGAIIPEPGFILVELDYKAQEFRLTLEYAGEVELCKEVEKGSDPHQATADMVGIPRRPAKTLNFALIYGAGKAKLAKMLGCSLEEAALLKAKYFYRLPGVRGFIRRISEAAKQRGFIYSWDRRKYFFPDPNECYKAPNCCIQGGGAAITKLAMVRIQRYLDEIRAESCMLAQIHDSILFQVKRDELHIIPTICDIMRNAYPHKLLPMDVDCKWSDKNWQEMVKGIPSGEATGS